ncbi:MAG: hypothetical protein OXI67_17540 [Candidatus Poribacteria bacterium]|nr:hypothetical protein [Candidatus Poribacteria bacterium]
MQTKKFSIFITLSLIFALICGTTIIGIAAINDNTEEKEEVGENFVRIDRRAEASEGPLESYSSTSVDVYDDDPDDGVLGERRDASTNLRSSGGVNFSGGYYYNADAGNGSVGGDGSFRGDIYLSASPDPAFSTLPEGEDPDLHAAIDSISAWSDIYGTLDEEDSEAYSHIPF